MVSMKFQSPIFTPSRRCAAWVDLLMDSWPPAATILASPDAICCMPRATARSPDPQTWFKPQAVAEFGMPALMAAWRAGFWPWAAVKTWPKMTSFTSSGETLARSMAAFKATVPRKDAATELNAPLKEPTGVRAAETMTMSWEVGAATGLLLKAGWGIFR